MLMETRCRHALPVSMFTGFLSRRALLVAMFTGHALTKRCAPHPVHPLILQILIQTVNCNSSPDNVSGSRGGRLLQPATSPVVFTNVHRSGRYFVSVQQRQRRALNRDRRLKPSSFPTHQQFVHFGCLSFPVGMKVCLGKRLMLAADNTFFPPIVRWHAEI